MIACHAVREVVCREDNSDCGLRLLAGQHLQELAVALRVNSFVQFLPSGREFPAGFDVRKAGRYRGICSVLSLTRLVHKLPRNSVLLFDSVGIRERLIGAAHKCVSLDDARNIYLAYALTLRQIGFRISAEAAGRSVVGRVGKVRIFPYARIRSKDIPPEVILRLVQQVIAAGFECEVITLTGEGEGLSSSLPVRKVARTFASLINEISSSSFVVTADSLPGHLAQFLGIVSYVIVQKPNNYWLPISCYLDNSWSTFSDTSAFPLWLKNRAHVSTNDQ